MWCIWKGCLFTLMPLGIGRQRFSFGPACLLACGRHHDKNLGDSTDDLNDDMLMCLVMQLGSNVLPYGLKCLWHAFEKAPDESQ